MLTEDRKAAYVRDGFVTGIEAMSIDDAAGWRARIETLVRGRDAERGWINVAGATRLFDPRDLALYEEVLAHQSQTLAAGAIGQVGLYAGKEGTA